MISSSINKITKDLKCIFPCICSATVTNSGTITLDIDKIADSVTNISCDSEEIVCKKEVVVKVETQDCREIFKKQTRNFDAKTDDRNKEQVDEGDNQKSNNEDYSSDDRTRENGERKIDDGNESCDSNETCVQTMTPEQLQASLNMVYKDQGFSLYQFDEFNIPKVKEDVLEIDGNKRNENDSKMFVERKNRNRKCDICSKTFCSPKYLMKHVKSHTGDKHFECNVCCKRFTGQDRLNSHYNTHTNDYRYECDRCPKIFKYLTGLTRHEATHTGVKLYKCNLCNKSFTHSYTLSEHLLTHDASNKNRYQCDVCDKGFTRATSLNRHKAIHIDHRPFECNACEKRFRRKGHLQKHSETHR